MIVVITPVGTSLFTNAIKNGDETIRELFEEIEDKPASEWDAYEDDYIRDLKTECEGLEGEFASAELQSTVKIQKALDDIDIIVHLLASYTIASRLAAEILRDKINNGVLGPDVTAVFNADPSVDQIDVIRDLQVENSESFSRKAMPKLFERINFIKDWIAGGSQNLAINITGGYGATLPYLTIFAQLEGVPLYYNFEGAKALITIPQVPLTINWELIKEYVDVINQLDQGNGLGNWREFSDTNPVAVQELRPFIYIDRALNDILLSPMGEIFWNDYLNRHFIVKLPPSGERGEIAEPVIDIVIHELYRRLHDALSPSYLIHTKSYKRLRELGHNDDLNHTGQVHGQEIFIFKSTDQGQVRLMYTFVVNGKTIPQLTIFDSRPHMNDAQYDTWKQQFQTPPSIDNFETRIFVK